MKQSVFSRGAGGPRLLANLTLTIPAALYALGWLAAPAFATDREWTGAVNGNWSESGNWNPAGTPQNGDNLTFDQNAFYLSNTNDLANLSISGLYFNNNYNYQLSGNSLGVLGIDIASGGSSTITINCPVTFGSGAFVDVSPGIAYLSGNETYLRFNGSITIENGQLNLNADASKGAGTDWEAGHIYVSGPLVGAGDIMAVAQDSGGHKGSIEFDSSSDSANFTGTLWLSSAGDAYDAPITFNQTSGALVASYVGVTNGETANLILNQSDQQGTTLDIESGGQLLLNGGNAAFAGIVIRNFSADSKPSVLDTGSILAGLNSGGIVIRCDNNNVTPTIKGKLNLNGDLPFDVHGTATIGLEIDASMQGGGFDKTGGSTLILTGANTFTDVAEVADGILDVRNSNALGAAPGGPVTLFGGSLTLHNSISGKRLWASGQSVAGEMPGSLLTAGGSNPITWSGPVVLNTNLVVVGGDVNLDGPISGAGGLFADNSGTIEIGGTAANSYTGTTLVRCPLLEFNKSSGTKAYAGPLVVGGGPAGPYEARWLQPYQNVYATLTLYANGVVNLNNNNEDFGAVTFNGGTVETGSGQFAIYQPLTVNSNSATAVINGYLGLPSGSDRNFVVADGPADPDLLVNAVIFGTPTFIKQGPGTMELANANTYSSTTLLDGGILGIANPGALGGAGCIISDGATLRLDTGGTIPNPCEAAGPGVGGTHGAIEAAGSSSATLSGTLLLDSATVINVASTASLGFSSSIYGSGPLTKIGAGPLTLSGGIANTYSGDTTNQSGPLYLAKSGGAVAIPGNLVLGPAPANAAASAILESPNSIAGDTATVNANSALNLNGRNQNLSQLNLNDGGSVLTGVGALNLGSGATVNVGSLNTGIGAGSHVGASITGNLGMPPNTSGANFNVKSYAISFPFDSRPELDVAANIVINGTGGADYSQLNVNGAVNLSGMALNVTLGYQPNTNDEFVIIHNNGGAAVQGNFNGLPEGATVDLGDQAFRISYVARTGHDVALTDIGTLFPPRLTIEEAGTNSVRLLWPTNALSFTLQSLTNLSATNWSPVSPSPIVIGTNNVVTNAADEAHNFYRLLKP